MTSAGSALGPARTALPTAPSASSSCHEAARSGTRLGHRFLDPGCRRCHRRLGVPDGCGGGTAVQPGEVPELRIRVHLLPVGRRRPVDH
ncbi:hypothetical protein E1261_14785 [Kribbella albertanoniae]|uniref:Uncharacterized protein n=1 Tax=Kribbella albertanoniae TaxID=1266829 RepID=A0A4R4Q410_9ACTN|nr:hypothetical protein E1261_14785 [Kribbella albertanoniae]